MRTGSMIGIITLLFAATLAAGEQVSLFNGRTLDGWEGNLDFFRVEDEAIVAGHADKKIPRNEFLCTTKKYGDFDLQLKVKLVGAGANAGIQFRSERIPNHHEVSGYQADVGAGWWGKLYDESRRNKVLAAPSDPDEYAKHLNLDGWNDYRIRCEGPRIQLWINGYQTVDYVEEDAAIARAGVIGVQIHGGPPSEAWYKDLRITELDQEDSQ